MFDIGEFNRKVEVSLNKNLDLTIDAIKQNMQTNNQVVTGRTRDSLKKDVNLNEGIIWGLDHMDTLEQGISPQRSRLESWVTTYKGLYQWYKNKGFTIQGTRDRRVASATTGQRMMGSLLYRTGGVKSVYTNEVPILSQRMMDDLGEIIINTKIL